MTIFLASFLASFQARARRKEGQTLVEYALILAVLAVVFIAVFKLLDTQLIIIFSAITTLLDTAQSSH
jgi:Flp pilus assembly pilin Flp